VGKILLLYANKSNREQAPRFSASLVMRR